MINPPTLAFRLISAWKYSLASGSYIVGQGFDLIEVKTRIFNMLEVRLLYKKLESANKVLEDTVRERTAQLLESEARYRCLTELASDWYWEQDESGIFTKTSGPVLEMLGMPVETLTAEPAFGAGDLSSGWNEDERTILRAKIAAREPFLDYSFGRVRYDGTTQRFRVSGEPIFDRSC